MSAEAWPTPFDWAGRYRDENTPWDLGGPHPEILRRLAAGELGAPSRVLVPGCGRGYDALALAEAGWSVTAVDVVALDTPALRSLRARGGRYVVTDALAFDAGEPFDLVLDHTFFCALAPAQRPAWGGMIERVLAAEGTLAVLVFPCGKTPAEGGPPHGMSASDLALALGNGFVLVRDEPALERVERRKWEERWEVFRRLVHSEKS